MPLPTLLAAQTSVEGRHRAVSPVAGKAAVLGLVMEQQKQFYWCWAAMAVGVRKFLSGQVLDQCEQANRQLDRSSCCDDPAACNQAMPLDPNLFAHAGGRFSFDQVKQQIDNHRPVGVQINWSGGGSHFVCIDGYNNAGDTPRVSVQDPWYGPSMVPYDTLAFSYHDTGTWADSFRI